MNVALLCLDRGVPLGGPKGASVHLRSVAAALLRGGHACHALVRDPGPAEELAPLVAGGLRITPLSGAPDAGALAAMLAAIRAGLVIERLSLLASEGARAAARIGIPHLYEVNAPLDREAARWRGLADVVPARATFAEGFAASRGAIAVSEEVAAWVHELSPPGYPVQVIPNGVDPAFLGPPDADARARAEARLGPRRGFRVAFVGTFRPWHDLEGLIEALGLARRSASVELVLLGDGPNRDRLSCLARERRVPLVETGSVPHREVHACLASCDAAAVPCSAADAWFSPLKLVEAMAAALPVVASATAPVRRTVRDGIDGVLVPVGDTAALARAVTRLALDPGLCARLGRAARATVRARGTWDHVVARVLDFALAGAERAS